jgi:hypothetical protein
MSKPIHLLITPTPRQLKLAEVKRSIPRSVMGEIPDSAIEQAIAVVPAVERWLSEHPDEASRLIHDPATTLEAMKQSGALTEPIDQLLVLLRSEPQKSGDRNPRVRALLAEAFREASASFGPARTKGDR